MDPSAPAGVQANRNSPGPVSASISAIEISGVSHRYGERVALQDVTFSVNSGEIFGLLGPNGSGKTTLFRILSTLMLPSSGSARICGYDTSRDANAVRRKIGVVFQAASFDPKLTAEENLRHQGNLYGLRGAALKARSKEMLARVGLTERAGERVETFSGGMQRRIELAKGLMHHPSVLLLDEPTTGLDPGARIDLWQYLKQLRDEQGISVLITTHLMEEAERCDRLGILHQGRLVALGAPSKLRGEIGGDVLVIESSHPDSLAERMRQRFQVSPQVLDGKIRLERAQGNRFATEVVETFPGEIVSVLVSKPTLEDVFIRHTGHRFWSDERNVDQKTA
jgi:ABC-2 type transport system ATP-binding protein